MIRMKQPSLVLHSHNVPGFKYRMWATWTVPKTLTPSTLVGWIEHAINNASEYMLHNVIINCHGAPGYLHIGSGVGTKQLEPFTRLRQKQAIGRIWIVACEVHKATKTTFGHEFPTALAKASGCSVVSADSYQYVYEKSLPYGHIDDYEGNAYAYNGSGAKELL